MSTRAPLPWLGFVRRSCAEGARWATEYEQVVPIQQTCQDAVEVLRRRGLEEGSALLRRAHDELCGMDGDGMPPSVRAVVDRWYYGAIAFYHYARQEYDLAEHYMDVAHDTVVHALEQSGDWLMPLALDCYEFEMHRARIARERPSWPALRRHADRAAAMRDGRIPLCRLGDGTAVGLGDVQRFYRALPDLTDEERELVASIVDDDLSRLQAERSIRTVLRLPGFVIQYP
jgi:hypothetical protein